jgi:large subunit ribosomal protein L11
MAKKIVAEVKLQIPAGAANPARRSVRLSVNAASTSWSSAKQFNAQTQAQQGLIIPVIITVYADRSFTFVTKTPPASILLKRAAGIEKGSGVPHKNKVGTVTKQQVREIAQLKTPRSDRR